MGANGVSSASLMGGGIDCRSGCAACVPFGFQNILFAIWLAKSVRNSIRMHHSIGLKDPPKVRRIYISAHILVEQMYLRTVFACKCILLHVDARLYLYMKMKTSGNIHRIACIICMTYKNTNP